MKMTAEVRTAIETLRQAAENNFEQLAIDRLETALTNPPRVEIVDETHQKFNGLVFYKDKQRGYYYENSGIHQAVWRYYRGNIPFDYNIHHVSGNKDDNNIENLQMHSRADHAREHGAHLKKEIFTCVVCGKQFEATGRVTTLTCSPNCRARKNHKPFKDVKETRQCVICGKDFLTSKFRNAETCSPHCTVLLARQSRRLGRSKQKYAEIWEARQCVICGNIFAVRARNETKCCSQACAGVMRSKAWKEAHR